MNATRFALIAALLLAAAAAQPASAQKQPFENKAWKEFRLGGLECSIFLPAKFKPARSSNPGLAIFQKTSKPVVAMGVCRIAEPVGLLSKTQFQQLVEALYYELYLNSDVDYYSVFKPSPIVNHCGHHGYLFMLSEFKGLKEYFYLTECFLDGKGYFYFILSTAEADYSPVCGSAVTFSMDNGTVKGLEKPMAPAACPPAPELADSVRELKKAVDRSLGW